MTFATEAGEIPTFVRNDANTTGGCSTYIAYSSKSSNPPKLCPHHKEVVAREKREAAEKRERENRERAQRVRENTTRKDYPHEQRTSENPRFYAACGSKGANLSQEERNRFSTYFHNLPDRERMPFDKIVEVANEWKRSNGGGFRRSDRS